MKHFMLIASALFTLSFFQPGIIQAQDDNPFLPEIFKKSVIGSVKVLKIEEVFIPGSFDDNDVTEVIVKGTLPNSCWQVARSFVSPTDEERNFQLNVVGFVLENEVCLPITSTFVDTVKIGELEAGQYSLQTSENELSNITKQFQVQEASSEERDNHLYAQVESIHLLQTHQQLSFEIQGRTPPMKDKCLVIKEVKAAVDGENVITVLPIMQSVPHEQCDEEHFKYGRPFSKRIYKQNPPSKPFLIHARSINGQSINRYVPNH